MAWGEVRLGGAVAVSAYEDATLAESGVRNVVKGIKAVFSDEMGLESGRVLGWWCVGVKLPGAAWERTTMWSWCCLRPPIVRLQWRGQQSPRR